MKIERDDYDEWRSSKVTEQLFKFFKLQADTYRAVLATGGLKGTDSEVGEKYKELVFAINAYDAMETISYEDLEEVSDGI